MLVVEWLHRAPVAELAVIIYHRDRWCFPTMAGAGLCGAGASIRPITLGQLDFGIAVGIAIGGIPSVLIARFHRPVHVARPLRWLVMGVVLYAALVMVKAAFGGRGESEALATATRAGGA